MAKSSFLGFVLQAIVVLIVIAAIVIFFAWPGLLVKIFELFS